VGSKQEKWMEPTRKPIQAKRNVVLIILLILIMIFYTVNNYFSMRDSLFTTIKEDAAVITKVANRLIETRLKLLQSDVVGIAQTLQGFSGPALAHHLGETNYTQKQILSLIVFGPQGIIASHGDLPAQGVLLYSSKYLRKAFTGHVVISTTYWDENAGKLLMLVYVPIDRDRVLAATIPGMLFSDLISDIRLWATGNIFILDEEGTLIGDMEHELVLKRTNYRQLSKARPTDTSILNAFEKILREKSGSGFYAYKGVERFCSWSKVSSSTVGWKIAVAMPLEEGPLAVMFSDTIFSTIFMLIGILCAIGLSQYAARAHPRKPGHRTRNA
jgi:methyl-accepting chemotaxis protein